MENLIFIKIEIFTFLFSFLYVLYYLGAKSFKIYFRVKEAVSPKKINSKKTALNKVNLSSKKRKNNSNKTDVVKVSEDDKMKVTEILKRVKVNSSKGYFDTARNLIVEGLSLDKYNRELNLELASIYEKEGNYLNAEYIYKDLLEHLKVDFEVMKKLGYIYAMQNKLKLSLKLYEEIHNKKMADDEVIDLLGELTFNMKSYKKALKYINLYLIGKPRNVDKLFMKAECFEYTDRLDDARPVFKRILELQPYNTKAKEKIEFIDEKQAVAA